jgi:hypothetical protein
MNSSFGRGFKNSFNKKNFSTFFKNSFNNKTMFKLFDTNLNSPFVKMQLANKNFSSKAIFLNNHKNLAVVGSKSLTGEAKNGVEVEVLENEEIKLGDAVTQSQGLILVKQGKL